MSIFKSDPNLQPKTKQIAKVLKKYTPSPYYEILCNSFCRTDNELQHFPNTPEYNRGCIFVAFVFSAVDDYSQF